MPLPSIPSGNVASATASTGYEIANSCLFNDNDSAYMHRTFGTPTNVDKWTFSVWLKRSSIMTGASQKLLNAYVSGNAYHMVQFSSGSTADRFNHYDHDTAMSPADTGETTSGDYRDVGGWYHLVVIYDSGNSDADLRTRLFVNGAEPSFSSVTNPGQNNDSVINRAIAHQLGAVQSPAQYFDGYMAEAIFCDGQAYTADNFGEYDTDSPSIWKPKDPSGLTFGDNGWWLDFEDGADLGKDVSGEGNHFTEVNFAAADQCIDSPTNNLCTLNPLHMSDPSANFFVDNGNNTLEATNNDVDRLVGATIHPQGIKGYFEFKILTDSNFRVALQEDGVGLTKNNYTALANGQFWGLDSSGHLAYANGGSSATLTSGYISSPSNGNIIGCAFDFTGSNRNVWFHVNGTYGNNGSGVGNPATGAYPGLSVTQLALTKEFEFVFMCNTGGSSSSIGLNFGNGSYDGTAISSAGTNASFGKFEYDCPSGFGAICSKTKNGTYE